MWHGSSFWGKLYDLVPIESCPKARASLQNVGTMVMLLLGDIITLCLGKFAGWVSKVEPEFQSPASYEVLGLVTLPHPNPPHRADMRTKWKIQ